MYGGYLWHVGGLGPQVPLSTPLEEKRWDAKKMLKKLVFCACNNKLLELSICL